MKMSKAWMVLVAAMSAPAFATEAPAKADPAKAQQIVSQVCVACHGADGVSLAPTNPHLAGQHAEYITKQLRDFKAGKDRKNAVMGGMVATLSDDDMRNLGAYYAATTPKPGAAKDAELAALGEKIYRGGIAATGVPACAACHGPTGAGIPAQYPRLAGQYTDYTAGQLKAFRGGERANDPNSMMRGVAARMSDREIQAVSEYVSGLR